ncbi:type I-E CRISPR-associated protein Cse2/CasB [Nocardia asteroides]|uniref:type I-E CRISPR-associated protein Cse2/CasB n=1 Tax=Nocardia asteroides TaxID=1824 RepID=UPI001E63DA64|nr:type I-E CRISPR-associated protein Cse2/CasB [Nocardia asteroides]UGT59942.1 type I-E CRISPR-associated protein Cse2/CasB [Nocardia asteroides]
MTNVSMSFGDREKLLRDYVSGRVSVLQRRYREQDADARAALAELRRGVGGAPGTDPLLWKLTVDGFPAELNAPETLTRAEHDGAATVWERAAFDAITLFALHQQSRTSAMHRAGIGLGAAVRVLGTRAGSEDAVRARFHALGTAQDHPARLIHLRGLITQCRAFDIALDYGRLAVDLGRLDRNTYADRVLLAWARDLHRRPREATADTPETGEKR